MHNVPSFVPPGVFLMWSMESVYGQLKQHALLHTNAHVYPPPPPPSHASQNQPFFPRAEPPNTPATRPSVCSKTSTSRAEFNAKLPLTAPQHPRWGQQGVRGEAAGGKRGHIVGWYKLSESTGSRCEKLQGAGKERGGCVSGIKHTICYPLHGGPALWGVAHCCRRGVFPWQSPRCASIHRERSSWVTWHRADRTSHTVAIFNFVN